MHANGLISIQLVEGAYNNSVRRKWSKVSFFSIYSAAWSLYTCDNNLYMYGRRDINSPFL